MIDALLNTLSGISLIHSVKTAASLAELRQKKILHSPTVFVLNLGEQSNNTFFNNATSSRVQVEIGILIALRQRNSKNYDKTDEMEVLRNTIRQAVANDSLKTDYKPLARGKSQPMGFHDGVFFWLDTYLTEKTEQFTHSI